jgi:broad specificity phosphatase PhoE
MRNSLDCLRLLRALLCAAVLGVTVVPSVASAQKLVLVVRHAERADGGSMAPTAQTDPLLSPAGRARAEKLAGMLAEAGLSAIYTTEFKRTQDTARPLAERLKMALTSVPSRETAVLVARIKKEHATDIVLVVGHSNTVPEVITAFGGPAIKMSEDEFGDLFVIVPATGAMTKVKY